MVHEHWSLYVGRRTSLQNQHTHSCQPTSHNTMVLIWVTFNPKTVNTLKVPSIGFSDISKGTESLTPNLWLRTDEPWNVEGVRKWNQGIGLLEPLKLRFLNWGCHDAPA